MSDCASVIAAPSIVRGTSGCMPERAFASSLMIDSSSGAVKSPFSSMWMLSAVRSMRLSGVLVGWRLPAYRLSCALGTAPKEEEMA